MSRIYHVNVITLLNGRGSLQFLLKDWDPGWDIRKALTKLVQVLKQPELEMVPQKYHPSTQSSSAPTALDFTKFRGNKCEMLHAQCVWSYMNDRNSFDKMAKDFTRRFACLPKGVLQRSEFWFGSGSGLELGLGFRLVAFISCVHFLLCVAILSF